MKSPLSPFTLPAVTALCAALLLAGSPQAHAWASRRSTPEERAKPPAETEAAIKTREAKEAKEAKAKPPSHASQVVVLAYHRFVDKVRHPDTEITVPEFEQQMQQLKDAGISVISMPDFLAWKRGEKEIPERSALVTFDDGWRSQMTKAWPVLKKFGYPFTMFIYTDYVKGGPRSGGESLTWQELEALRDAGVAIESHTVSHADLRGKRSTRGTPEYDAWLKNELVTSREMLEQRLGIKVRALAVPYGNYNATVQDAAAKAGYEALFTVRGGMIDTNTPANEIGRYIIPHENPKLFQTALRSVGSDAGESTPAIAELTGVALTPEDASSTTEKRPTIRANVRPFGKLKPESLTMRLSGAGLVQANYDPKAGTFTHQPKSDLPPGSYTVIISAEADGKRHEGRWTFEIKETPKPTADQPVPPAAEEAEKEGTAPKKNEETVGGDTP